MPATEADYAKVTAQREKAAQLVTAAGTLTAGARTFEDEVMTGVRAAREARGPSTLETAVGTTTGQIISAPAAMRGRMADVNPLDVDVLTSKQTGQTLSTLATLGEIKQAREGTIQEVIGAGVNRLLAEAEVKRAEAERASAEADSLDQAIRFQQELANRRFDEWEATERLNLAKQVEARQAKQGGGGGGTAGEREASKTKQAAIADAQGGLNAQNFAAKYGGTLEDWELINIYNQNSPYGGMTESPSKFAEWTGSKKEGSTSQWETIQAVKQNAYQAELNGSSQDEVNAYIRAQGFEPWEINYVYTEK